MPNGLRPLERPIIGLQPLRKPVVYPSLVSQPLRPLRQPQIGPMGYLPGRQSVGEAVRDYPYQSFESLLDEAKIPASEPVPLEQPEVAPQSLLDSILDKVRDAAGAARNLLDYMPSIISAAEGADKMTISEKEDLIRGVFGDEGDLAVAIAKAESFPDLKEEAEGPKGEDSWGIFQINWDIWGPDAVSKKDGSVGVGYKKVNRQLKSFLGRDWEKDDLKNPEANVRAAKIIRDLKGWGGWDQWMGYTKGGYKKFYNP